MPGSKELVGLAPHRITTVQQPAVGILVDGHRVHTLQLGLSIFFEVTGLVAGIYAGRLAGIHAGRGDLGLALTVHELEVVTKRSHLELPGVKSLRRGFRLLPASAYPDEPRPRPDGQQLAGQSSAGQHRDGQLPGAELPGAVTAAAPFPGVNLTDGQVPAANLTAASPLGPRHRGGPLGGQPGPEHPYSAEPDYSSIPWWQKSQTQAGPARTS
jgi:hypothetical protein